MFPPAAPARSQIRRLAGRLWSRLAADAAGWWSLALAAGLWLFFLGLALRPGTTAARNEAAAFTHGPLLFLGLAAGYAALARRRGGQPAERRYWLDLALGLGAWAAAAAGNLLGHFQLFDRDHIRLPIEFGYALSYVFVVAAVEARPDDSSPAAEGGRTPRWHAAVVVSGLFATLVLLPKLFGGPGSKAYFSSFALYTAMDLYVAGRALYLAFSTPSRRWRWNFASLGFAFTLLLFSDLATAWLKREGTALTDGTWRDAFWLLPFSGMIVAGAAGAFALEDRRRTPLPPTLSEAFAAPPLTWALCFPVFHFAAGSYGFLDPQLAGPRDLLVIAFTLILLALAWYRQRIFEQGLAELIRERREVQAQLRENENDLRLLLHRSQARELIRSAEERSAKALGSAALMADGSAEQDGRQDRLCSLFELARLPLRLLGAPAGEPNGASEVELFANRAGRKTAAGGELAAIEMGEWRLVIGAPGQGS